MDTLAGAKINGALDRDYRTVDELTQAVVDELEAFRSTICTTHGDERAVPDANTVGSQSIQSVNTRDR